jgi:TetR/AcrR family transcriptional repressor of nem operon
VAVSIVQFLSKVRACYSDTTGFKIIRTHPYNHSNLIIKGLAKGADLNDSFNFIFYIPFGIIFTFTVLLKNMSKAEKTKEFIIEKARPLFNKKGYAGTSMNDLTEATGLTKGAIYGNFQNKDEVAVAAFKSSITRLGKRLDDFIENQNSATEKFIGFTQYYRANWERIFDRGGCPILNASIEADDNLPFLKKHVQAGLRTLVHRISKIIEEGMDSGEFRKNINPVDHAYMFISILEGGIMLGKIENNPKYLFAGLDRMVKIMKEELLK